MYTSEPPIRSGALKHRAEVQGARTAPQGDEMGEAAGSLRLPRKDYEDGREVSVPGELSWLPDEFLRLLRAVPRKCHGLVLRVLARCLEDEEYLGAWKLLERITRTNRRYSAKAWLFCFWVTRTAEKLIRIGAGRANGPREGAGIP